MYEKFYHMTHTPFSRKVPPEALYESKAMTDCLGRLAYVADRQLFAVVTADAGCGKSTLIRKFSASLSKEKYIFLYLSDSKLTPRWFYKGLLDQLVQIPLHRITDSASNGSVFPVVTEHFSASSDHAFL